MHVEERQWAMVYIARYVHLSTCNAENVVFELAINHISKSVVCMVLERSAFQQNLQLLLLVSR